VAAGAVAGGRATFEPAAEEPAAEPGVPPEAEAGLPAAPAAAAALAAERALSQGVNNLVASLPRVIESTAAPDAERAATVPDGTPMSTDGSEGSFSLT
jgi:hypothetical protein